MDIKINGVVIPTPSSYSVDISDIDSTTTRTADGTLRRDRVAVKRKISLEFPPLKQADMSKLLKAIQDTFFEVTYLDPILEETTKTFYVGDRSTEAYSFNAKFNYWTGIKFNFIER